LKPEAKVLDGKEKDVTVSRQRWVLKIAGAQK
jgi:hypothetical protein